MPRKALCLVIVSLFVAACGEKSAPVAGSAFQPINPDAVLLWDRQITETGALMREIVAEYNAAEGGLPIQLEYIGGYSEIFRKVNASILAKRLPAMAVGYESMTSVYIQAGAVMPLEPLLHDPEIGLSQAELEDFFPGVIETNTYEDFGGKMYSFPYTKSVLVMYFNKRVLASAGIETPPRTWDEFLAQCRAVKEKTGKFAYSLDVDPSTIDGMIMSHGGELVSGRSTLFDSPQALAVFTLLDTLFKEKLAFQNPPGTYDDSGAFSRDELAFVLRTSSSQAYIDELMEGDSSRWSVAPIPQADPDKPVTVLFGGNIILFNTTPEQERAAWRFVKHFTSPAVMARWAVETGYLPTRRSVQNEPLLQEHWAKWEYNRTAFDCLSFARSEPNLAGWQNVRHDIEKAVTSIITGVQSPSDAAETLKRDADRALEQTHGAGR